MPESNIAQLDRLMAGFPWTLSRGPIRMGPAFDEWTLEALGFGPHMFVVRGPTPDLAVAAAIQHLTREGFGALAEPTNDDLAAEGEALRARIAELEARAEKSKPEKKPRRRTAKETV